MNSLLLFFCCCFCLVWMIVKRVTYNTVKVFFLEKKRFYFSKKVVF